YTTIEEYITYLANTSINLEGSDFISVTGTGTDGDPYVVSIEGGEIGRASCRESKESVVWARIEDIVQDNETITTLVDNGDGTYTDTNEAGDTFVIDVPASVVEKFETIVNSDPVEINGETYTTIEEYITYLANTSINLEGSDFISVTGTGTDGDPYVVSIEGG